jgi:hypothetical protein
MRERRSNFRKITKKLIRKINGSESGRKPEVIPEENEK